MATIVIKDLPDNIDLDRQAMSAITGGSRTRGRPVFPAHTIFRSSQVVSYPAGFVSSPLATGASRPRAASKPLK